MRKVITIQLNLCYEERIYSRFRNDCVITKSYDDSVISYTAAFSYDKDSGFNKTYCIDEFCSELVRKIVEDGSCRITSFLIMTEQRYGAAKLMCANKFLSLLENSVSCILHRIFKDDLIAYETENFSERCYYDKYYIDISTPVSVTIR